jgi:hypothetical protein
LSPDDRADIMWNFSISRADYKQELAAISDPKGKKDRSNRYLKATVHFFIQGTTLMRKAEVLAADSIRPIRLPPRRVIMANAAYDEIKAVNHRLLHAGRDKT